MLTLKGIRKRFGTRRILEGVSFSVGEGQKVALVGENGVGKSTLLKIIAGLETAEKGELLIINRALVGYLPQEALALSDTETVGEFLERMAGMNEIQKEMNDLSGKLETTEAQRKYEEAQAAFERLGGYQFRERSRGILEGLSIASLPDERAVATLSGGEKRKLSLAGVLLRGVDLLLLDEPTNNLDLPALLWLERYLARSKATAVIVSHDRMFLDTVVTKIIEIDPITKQAEITSGTWSDFAAVKAHRYQSKLESYRMQEEEKVRVLASAAEKKVWMEKGAKQVMPDRDRMSQGFHRDRSERKFGTQARVLEDRAKRLNKVERPVERLPIEFEIPKEGISARIEGKSLVIGYPDGYRSEPLDIAIEFGERVGVFGRNGAGKTTLLLTLLGDQPPLSGEATRGEGLVVGNILQEHDDLPRAKTAQQIFKERFGVEAEDKIRVLLERFRFSLDLAETKLKDVSPGERVRVALALLVAQGANAIALDEPTNHLDLESIEALEDALEHFSGTLIVVTHDRRFIQKLRLSRLLLLESGTLIPLESYDAYQAKLMPGITKSLKRLEERIERKF